ncbi:hypothetical protein [Sphingomonas sp. Leaf339]|uniref:hypothetical protein n=1 Tax=Sphingomonas sp. Leaf339 TaxID=1736343 RepID=UPI0012E3F5A5|nr:hypothetical protein [Sphingomonas sp. Leaf339]
MTALLLAGCVGDELRRTSSLTAAEVNSYNSDLIRFNSVHQRILAEMDSTAAENAVIVRAAEALVDARVSELNAGGSSEAVRLFEAATPPVPPRETDLAPIVPPVWNSGAQENLIKALNKVSSKRSTGRGAELLLGFAFDVAKGMKKDAEKAAISSNPNGK